MTIYKATTYNWYILRTNCIEDNFKNCNQLAVEYYVTFQSFNLTVTSVHNSQLHLHRLGNFSKQRDSLMMMLMLWNMEECNKEDKVLTSNIVHLLVNKRRIWIGCLQMFTVLTAFKFGGCLLHLWFQNMLCHEEKGFTSILSSPITTVLVAIYEPWGNGIFTKIGMLLLLDHSHNMHITILPTM